MSNFLMNDLRKWFGYFFDIESNNIPDNISFICLNKLLHMWLVNV